MRLSLFDINVTDKKLNRNKLRFRHRMDGMKKKEKVE